MPPRPSVAALALLLGLVLVAPRALAHGSLPDRIDHLSHQIEHDPKNVALLIERAELRSLRRENDLAVADLLVARRLDPTLPVIDLYLGRAELEAGNAASAKRFLDDYLTRRPEDARGLLFRARAQSLAGDHLAAAADYATIIANSDHPAPTVFLERARAFAAAGPEHFAAAIQTLDDGVARLGPAVQLRLEAVELSIQRGDTDGALSRLDGLAADSRRPERWLLLQGQVLRDAGRHAEARSAFERGLAALDTLPPHVRQRHASVSAEIELREALTRLDATLESTP